MTLGSSPLTRTIDSVVFSAFRVYALMDRAKYLAVLVLILNAMYVIPDLVSFTTPCRSAEPII